jgi:hypothetical protein
MLFKKKESGIPTFPLRDIRNYTRTWTSGGKSCNQIGDILIESRRHANRRPIFWRSWLTMTTVWMLQNLGRDSKQTNKFSYLKKRNNVECGIPHRHTTWYTTQNTPWTVLINFYRVNLLKLILNKTFCYFNLDNIETHRCIFVQGLQCNNLKTCKWAWWWPHRPKHVARQKTANKCVKVKELSTRRYILFLANFPLWYDDHVSHCRPVSACPSPVVTFQRIDEFWCILVHT